jgi:hypothetical protein
MPEITTWIQLCGFIAILAHQVAAQWVTRNADKRAIKGFKALRSEITECRARWDAVQVRMERVESALSLLARGAARPPESPAP